MNADILFTTSDGISIKMGDIYWYYNDGSTKLHSIMVRSWQDYGPAKGIIQFGAVWAAIEYKK